MVKFLAISIRTLHSETVISISGAIVRLWRIQSALKVPRIGVGDATENIRGHNFCKASIVIFGFKFRW
jgi:hypothetical protein